MGDKAENGSAESTGLRRWGRIAFQVVFTGAVTYFLFRTFGITFDRLRELNTAGVSFELLPLVGATLLFAIGHSVNAGTWAWLLRQSEQRDVASLVTLVRVFLVANLGRYIPGKVWQVASLSVAAQRLGVSATVASIVAVASQLVAVAAAAAWGASSLRQLEQVSLPLLGLVALGFAVLVLAGPAVLRWMIRHPRFPGDSSFNVSAKDLWAVAAVHLVNWGLYGLAFHLIAIALSVSVTPWESMSYFGAAYVAGYLFLPAPAGIGVREGVLLLLLAGSAPANALLAVTIIQRLLITVTEVLPIPLLSPGRGYD